MKSFAVGLFTLGVFLAAGVFLVEPEPSGIVGTILSIPHWPARLLRWVGVGAFFDTLVTPLADWLLHFTGKHPLVHVVVLCAVAMFIGGAIAQPEEQALGPTRAPLDLRVVRFLVLAVYTLLGFPFISAWLAGMHLSRLSSRLEQETQHAQLWASVDLFMGAEPINEDAAPRTITRLGRISGDRLLVGTDPLADEGLARHRADLVTSYRDLRAAIKEAGAPAQMVTLTALTELALHLALPRLLEIATQGRGGDPDQPWRSHRFDAPLGPISLRTNFLPPDRSMIPLSPDGFARGTQNAANHIMQGGQRLATLHPKAPAYFAHVDDLAKVFDLNDAIVRMWYSTLAGYYFSRSVVQAFTDNVPGVKLAESDLYGELTVNLHNSCASYGRAVGEGAGDLISAGIYLSRSNEIHVWLDERAYEQVNARSMLNLASSLSGRLDSLAQDSLLEYEIVGAVAAAVPLDRISGVLFHELVHWTVHASLASMPYLDLGGSPAFEEGFALMLDNAPLEMLDDSELEKLPSSDPILAALARGFRPSGRSDPELYEFVPSGDCPSYSPIMIDWACVWLAQDIHSASSPQQLALLSRQRFYARNLVRERYSDAWALVRLFGVSVLAEALSRQASIREVVTVDPLLATPWRVLQDDIRRFASAGVLPTVTEQFNRCR